MGKHDIFYAERLEVFQLLIQILKYIGMGAEGGELPFIQPFFHLRGGKEICAADTLHSIEERFTEEDGFFKCHRSYLVYMPNVDRFGTTELRMKSGSSIPIARGYGKAFKEAYFSMMFRD